MTRRPCFAIALSLLAMSALARAQVPAGASGAEGPASEAGASAAQPAGSAAPVNGPGGPGEGGFDTYLIREALPIEIATASYYELAAMAKGLGLSDAGAADELRKRLYDHFKIEAPPSAEGKGRVVKIERASEASYAKVVEDGEIVRASGGVILSLVDENGDSHRVEADRISYDRDTGSMTARGSVRYERTSGSATEVFTGEALSASLEDWSGVFLDGSIRRSAARGQAGTAASAEGERGVVISADVVSKRSSEVMVLKDGVVSACDAEDPHYSIKAGKIWILGDREWALSNAVFSLGNVPIMWLPFFYYPGEEIVFHPVLGYRTREGRFVQTTTYLAGSKPKAAGKTTILSMMGTGPDRPTKLSGVFLRRVSGAPPKDEGTLKVMADAYSGLGLFAGVQGSLPKVGKLGKTDFFAGLGLSRSLFPTSMGYSPFAAAGGWTSVWNSSSLFGLELPARYGLDFSTSLSIGSLSMSLALPLYSDPFIDRDFRNRSEDMDWLKLFSSSEGDGVSVAIRTQLQPKLDLSLSLKPKGLSPWLQSFNVTKFASSLTFATKDRPAPADATLAALLAVDPGRKFFYPSTFRPLDVSLSLGGSLAPEAGKAQGDGAAAAPDLGLRSPWEEGEEAGAAPGGASGSADSGGSGGGYIDGFRLPATIGSASAAKADWSGSTSWNMAPSAYWEESYRGDDVLGPGDIDFERQYSLVSYRLSASLDGSLSYGSDLLKGSLGLSFATQGQERPYVYDEGSAAAASFRLADYKARSRRVGGKASLSARPFSSSWLWGQSSLSWGMDATLYSLAFDELSGGAPVYKESFLGWDDSSISSHNLSLYVAARPRGLTQSLTLTASLPPKDESYSAGISLNAGPATLAASGKVFRGATDEDFSASPVTATLAVGSASAGPRLADTFVYDPEAGEPVSNTLSASWGGSLFSSSFTAKRSTQYRPTSSGWSGYGGESFRPSEIKASLNPRLSSPAGAGRFSWTLAPSLSLSQDLLKFSTSALALGLSATLNAGKDFSLTVSAQSQNSSAWRYYPYLFEDEIAAAGRSAEDFYVSPLEDLWNSISLWDTAALERGLVKLKSLSLEAKADLHDWTLTMTVSANPKLADDRRSYYLDASFSMALVWKDFSDIRADIKMNGKNGLTY